MALLCLFCILWAGATASLSDFSVKPVSGIFFRPETQVTAYEKSFPLFFKSAWGFPSNDDSGLPPSSTCRPLGSEQCRLEQKFFEILQLNNDTAALFQRALDFETVRTPKVQRRKRGLQMLGDFFSFCCEVATTKHLKNLFTNEQSLDDQVNTIKELVHQDHQNVIEISEGLNKMQASYQERLKELHGQVKGVLENMGNKLITSAASWEIRTVGMLILGEIQTQKIIMSQYRSSIMDHCRVGHIPSLLVTPAVLKKDLTRLINSLRSQGLDLAIPIDQFSQLYRMPVAECQFSTNDILIKINIPTTSIKAQWKVYQVIPAPFAFNNLTCYINTDGPAFLAVDGLSHRSRTIKGSDLQHCNPPVTDLCHIPPFPTDADPDHFCLFNMFYSPRTSELNKRCQFRCSDRQKQVSIRQVHTNTYVIAHLAPDAEVRDLATGRGYPLGVGKVENGALVLTLPCNRTLVSGNVTLIDRTFPCSPFEAASHDVHLLLPVQWTTVDSAILNSLEPHVVKGFKNLTQVFDSNWPAYTPHFVELSTYDLSRLKNVTLHGVSKGLFENDFLGDIVYLAWLGSLTLVQLIILVLIFKIYINQVYLSALSVPPPLPPKPREKEEAGPVAEAEALL